jgi:hypothetical protein
MKNESTARHTRMCDSCNAEILYPDQKNNVTMDLNYEGDTGTETSKYNSDQPLHTDNRKTTHYCSPSCALAHLTKIVKAQAKSKKVAKGSQLDAKANVLMIDVTASEGYPKK